MPSQAEFEAWIDFRRGEMIHPTKKPLCAVCKAECSGDTTVADGGKEYPICDELLACDERWEAMGKPAAAWEV